MKSISFLALGSLFVAIGPSSTLGAEQAGHRELVTCAAVTCSIDSPICVIQNNGNAACIKDPCVDVNCDEGSFCQVDDNGKAECAINPNLCWAVRCPSAFPKCVVVDGLAECVEDPCAAITCADGEVCFEQDVQCIQAPCPPIATCIMDPCADLICNAASTCEIDGTGEAFCLPLPGNPGNPIDDVTCANVRCPGDAPFCTIAGDGTVECTNDPCADIKCDKDSVCQLDDTGSANCVTYNPCWAVRCSSEFPKCVVVDGSAQCVEDVCANFICAEGEVCFAQEVQCIRAPCPPIATCIPKNPCAELICNAASTCEIDKTGKAFCQPLPGNPGNPIDDVTCANVRCPGDAPFCTILADGTAECSAEVPIKGAAATAPAWWELVKKNFTGEDLARCGKRKNVAPADGAKCSKKKRKNKTCFFGSQECASVGAYPDTRCKCTDGKWKCDSGIACPSN